MNTTIGQGLNTERQTAECALEQVVATQRAILDSLPAHVCLLDSHGVIVAVNAAWGLFGAQNGLASSGIVGENYLAVCDRAKGAFADEAREVGAGIRAILSGASQTFCIEYPCHAPGRERWFRMTVTAVERGAGSVVMHLDITAERATQLALRASEARQRAIVDNEPECVKVTSLAKPTGASMSLGAFASSKYRTRSPASRSPRQQDFRSIG